MQSNTKLLVLSSLIIILLGFGLLWFGLESRPFLSLESQNSLSTTPPPETIYGEATPSAEENQAVLVTKVIDGDTIEISGGVSVRLLGIDTPETVDPRRSVECFGKQASSEVKKLLSARKVLLEKDVSETDKYSRLLRYVYLKLEDGNLLFINDYLVREGFAKALTYPPDVRYSDQFLEAQRQARENKKGLWGKC